MRPVYTDASSAILLEKAGLFDLLSGSFNLVVAPSVFCEITQPGYPGADVFTAAEQCNKLTIQSPLAAGLPEGLPPASLDRGETDTLCLFLAQKQGFILTDDGKAAQWCDKNLLPFINALLVPRLFWYAGLMTKEESLNKMDVLCRMGRYADQVRAFAFSCTREDLSSFIPEPGHDH